jgi:glutamine cyclotransferase
LIYILTWLNKFVFVIDPQINKIIKKIPWGTQGWGMTHNGSHIFISDGSDSLYIVDENLKILETKHIKD